MPAWITMRRRALVWVPATKAIGCQHGEHVMSKSQDAKKNVKKAPTKTPKEKKEAKRLKKAERKF